VPAEKADQHGSNRKIEKVVRGRCSAFDEEREDEDLEYIRDDR
jgi:hypothetical protein